MFLILIFGLLFALCVVSKTRLGFLVGIATAVVMSGYAIAEQTASPTDTDLFHLSLADVKADDWLAQGIAFTLQGSSTQALSGRLKLLIRIASVQLPEPHKPLKSLELRCDLRGDWHQGWRCEQGAVSIADSAFGVQTLTWSGQYQRGGLVRLQISGFQVARGRAELVFSREMGGDWQADLDVKKADLGRLARQSHWLGLPRDWKLKGKVRVGAVLSGQGAKVASIVGHLDLRGLGFASPDSRYEADQLGGRARLSMRSVNNAWRGSTQWVWDQGQLYLEPLFLESDTQPLKATFKGLWRPGPERLVLQQWSLTRDGSFTAEGSALIDTGLPGLLNARFDAHSDQLERLYGYVLQPFLIGTAIDELAVSGAAQLSGAVDSAGLKELNLALQGLKISDGRDRFGLGTTQGTASWHRSTEVPVQASTLHIEQASVYRLKTRPFRLSFVASGDRIHLSQPLSVPVLSGAFDLATFELQGLLRGGFQWQADAALNELSITQLTEAFDWPPFSGTLSAQLPGMRYRDASFSAGGGLNFTVFGGDIQVQNLVLREPFGYAPVLEAGVRMRSLDLEQLTRTFSFGSIQGVLDGDLEGLELVAWEPNRFALQLQTPPGDRSRRRISQRAVENLTELGSGVPAGLSSGLLRIFDDFGYDRIDLQVRLDGDVALMNGIARSDGGYYLVKGAGLPRIDVIGRNRRVAWKDLVERLKQIRVEGAQIK